MLISPETDAPPRTGFFPKHRIAVSLLFMMNGFMVGCWAPKIPDFAARLALSDSALGLMILVFGIGSLVLMPIAGAQIAQRGSSVVVKAFAIALTPTLMLVTLAGNIPTAAVALFLFGGCVGAMDVAMNANAVEVEKTMRRAIMSSCHAFWSLGGLIGAGAGGFIIAHFGTAVHAVIITIAAGGMVVLAWPSVLQDAPHAEEVRQKARLPMTPLPWLIGLIALFSMVPEGSVLDWGALYLREELGASVAVSGFGFAAFSLTMAAMRFAGDLVRDRLGAVLTLRLSTIVAIVGMLAAGLAPTASIAIIGFAIAGIGISNMAPIAFSAAGNMPGLAPGVGLSVVTTMGYSGILFAPSSIGFVAEHTSFSVIFIALPALLVVVLACAGLARHADSIRR